MRTLLLTLVLTLCLVPACSDDSGGNGGNKDGGSPAADQAVTTGPHCNPISTDNCLLPWPSSYYLKKDTSSTVTGWRVNYPQKALPTNLSGKQLNPARHNLADGFPVGSQPIIYLAGGFSAGDLVGMDNIADSLTDKSLIWIFDMSSGEKVPFWSELDHNADPGEIKPLIIRPAKAFSFNTRHAIVLRKGLKDAKGSAITAPAPFQKVLDGAAISDTTLKAEATRLAPVITFLTGKGIKKDEILLAWDFHTVSKEFVRGNLTDMVAAARAKLPASGPKYTITKTLDTPTDKAMLRYVVGKVKVPSFLESDSDKAVLKLDSQGKPVYRGEQEFIFRVNIPKCAKGATKPLPILFYGMGLFSWPETEMGGSFSAGLGNNLCMITASTAWIGLSKNDLANILSDVITEDFTNLPMITDRLQQAHVNFHALVKLMQGDLLKDKAMQVDGKAVADGKERYYIGISNGGIQGVSLAALEPDISRYVFNVSGGFWSLMIQRSSNFVAMAIMLKARYPNIIERTILVSLAQHLFEFTDPAAYADMLLAGTTKRQILFQQSINDDQVPNVSTNAVARTMGIPQLTPTVKPIYGLTQKAGPLDSAFMQWDLKLKYDPGKYNIPAPKPPASNSPHNVLRSKSTCLASWKKFFTATGKVENPCSGACDPD